MKQHASRRSIPEPVEEEFDSDEFFANEPAIPAPPEADEEIGTGYEFAASEGSFTRSALKLLGIR
jgi:hypothetical protein